MYSYPVSAWHLPRILIWLMPFAPASHALHQQQQPQQQPPGPGHAARETLPGWSSRRHIVATGQAWPEPEALELLSSGQRELLQGGKSTQGSQMEEASGNTVIVIVLFLFVCALGGVAIARSVVQPNSGENEPLMKTDTLWHGNTAPLLQSAVFVPSASKKEIGRYSISTWSSGMSSPIGSGWLGTTCSPASPLSLPTSLTVHAQEGETFSISGLILPQRQASARIDIKRISGNVFDVVSRLHVAEDKEGSGILMELLSLDSPYGQVLPPRVAPFAFLDTAAATRGRHEATARDRQVSIFGASQDSLDATALPSATMKAIGDGRFVMLQDGQVILSVFTDVKNHLQLSHVEGKDSQLLARVMPPGNGQLVNVSCNFGADAGLVLCAVVACMKLL